MNVKTTLYQVLMSLPYVVKKLQILFDCGYKPDHYYRTLSNLDKVRTRKDVIYDNSKTEIKGINLNRQDNGVLNHFRNIHFPFEFPELRVLNRKWFWNKNHIFKAYLSVNLECSILNFNASLHKEFPDWFREHMPVCIINANEVRSIWIRKN
ncbi:MAG: hypothetical protein M3Q95_10325 [Bacteroidota bacterium]|nr:hypothetical protein [Bacteroidota bacterium]